MILSDTGLATRLDNDELVIDPITDFDQQIQPASIDFRLGNEFKVFNAGNITTIDPQDGVPVAEMMRTVEVDDGESYTIQPGEFVLGETEEWIEVPADLLGFVKGRSSLGRLGLLIHATAGVLDPGFEGSVTLEFCNLAPAGIELTPGMRIGQFVFAELDAPADRPYGEERGSKYQRQTGVTASGIENDPEFEN